MTEKNNGGPAFPIKGFYADSSGFICDVVVDNSGMSLRDYFAAKAMQGLISACNSDGIWTGCGDKKMNDNMAITAYMVADSMLKAREEK